MTDVIPYTHWAYFKDEKTARECAADLAECGFYQNVRRSYVPQPGEGWLMRASREVPIDDLVDRHAMVEEVVNSHGGVYDGGEATVSVHSGEFEWDYLIEDGEQWSPPRAPAK